MNDFNQDMQNLLNAYDSDWDDYLVLRKQFIEKYSLSVEKLQERCDRYEKALTEIASPNMIGAARIPLYRKIASEALAEIGGESESLDN